MLNAQVDSSRLQIAPMVDWTNSPFRILMRLLLPHAKLFTEMIVPRAIIHQAQRHLDFNAIEHPLVLQLGGSFPAELLQAAQCAEAYGYDEINLNLGCPSERVQAGAFGACLMKQKELVRSCLSPLHEHLSIPVTAKIRIGVDEFDSYSFFQDFVSMLVETGCREIIVHARKAWLKGLNPKQNRTIPPIHYDVVYQIQQAFPHINFIINGEIKTVEQMKNHLQHVHGVMLGRLACDNPYLLTQFHQAIYPNVPILGRRDIVEKYLEQINWDDKAVNRISFILKPLFNLYHGTIYSKLWKQSLQMMLSDKNIDGLLNIFNTKVMI